MDVNGWHNQRRAQREDELFSTQRTDSQDIGPMNEQFIGGFNIHQLPPPSPRPPALPPKDGFYEMPGHQAHGSFYEQPEGRRPSGHSYQASQSTITSTQLTNLSAVERSQALRVARMNPHLQVHLDLSIDRYDTVDEHGVWHGAAMIVTADSGSIYEPHPTLTYEWNPDNNGPYHNPQPVRMYDLGPHPADPHSTIMPMSPTSGSSWFADQKEPTPRNASKEVVPGQEIYVYGGPGGYVPLTSADRPEAHAASRTFTFWRFLIQIPLGLHEMIITYSINAGQQLAFYVPGRSQNMRWAVHSVGLSAGVNQNDFCGPGFKSGYDPVWVDLLNKHAETPFHALVGGGDQLYCDGLMREPELQEWVSGMKPDEKQRYIITEEMSSAIDRFYFNHYCASFRRDPHELQQSSMFRRIGERGYFYFLLFQCFINPGLDGYSDNNHVSKSIITGDDGPYVQSRSHSFLGYLGPQSYILLLDCRGERRKEQICSPLLYEKVFQRLAQLPSSVEHLIVLLGIPIAYPRMVFLETALESKFNPLVALGRVGGLGSIGMSGFVNKFNADAELLDDLNDHWTARSHKRERNWFIEQLQIFAGRQKVRVTFVAGDVHCAAVGVLKSLKEKGKPELAPAVDHRYMLNVVSSAIVNTPPPNGVITMVSSLATKVHKTLHHINTDETMVWYTTTLPLFQTDTNGQPRKQKFIMGRRNWCKVVWDPRTGDLVFDLRIEKEKGLGETVG
ncbi:hypothetical protein H0H81_005364 [Sphagnurus paluster]|uniref:PhoD-like phosphatase domain-containing protein n=1 Tax=Sphagnurus paluster TaxID=117069 RepID=A0A9P7GLN6_9AGAR|nr:hypothetical protein H0H81_005364 [Sphagnurus paluster]